MLSRMFVFILFVLVKSSSCNQCIELKSFHILDCSGQGISTFPRYSERNWVEVLVLKDNNITYVNVSAIMMDFPRIQYIDLRDNPLDCTMSLVCVKVNISSDCPHTTVRPTTAVATTSPAQRRTISVLSPAAPQTHQARITSSPASVSTLSPANASTPSPTRTGRNHSLLLLLILVPAGAIAIIIAFFAIRRRMRRRPSVYDQLFVLNNVRSQFSIDSLSSDSMDEEINYMQDSVL